MNKEKVKQLLQQLGVDANGVVNAMAILSDSETADLPYQTVEAYATAINSAREELYMSKNKQSIIDAHETATGKDKWLNYERPILGAIKRAGGFEKAELDGLTAKEAVALLAQRKDAQFIAHKDTASSEYITTINDLKTSTQDFKTTIERLEGEKITIGENAAAEAKETIYQFHAEKVLSNRMYSESIEFDIPEKRSLYSQLILPKILANYKINQDGTILAKDGTKALSFDRNGFYNTVDDAIKDLAKDMNILKVSNGGSQNAATKVVISDVKGKKVDSSGLNFLTKHLSGK